MKIQKSTKIIIGLMVGFIIAIGLTVGWLISIKFQAGTFENKIIATNDNLKNVHSSVNKILTSSGITVKNFGETKIKAIKESIARYADKPQLMMQFVQENPQQIDSRLWENFQKQIEVQYTKFEMEQKYKISVVQEYKNFLDNTVRGNVAGVVWSYPRAETVNIMKQVIITEDSKETFETGIDKAVDVFESKGN